MAHPEEERQELGRNLAKARADAGYSLQSAADELNARGFEIKRGTIGAWETGRNLPDALWMRRLARLYQTTVDALTGGAAPWPFSDELQRVVILLTDEELYKAEGVLRAHLGMPQSRVSPIAQNKQFNTVQSTAAVHHPYPEDGGWPHQLTTPEPPSKHGSSTKDRRPALAKGRRGT